VSYNSGHDVNSQENTPRGVSFSEDGTQMFVIGTQNDTIYQYTLSTGFDISTASYDSKSFSVNSQDSSPASMFFKTDGAKFYIVGYGSDAVYQYSVS
jgi:sugar lactone lactonase YvrE